jgi:heme exporter protein B
MSHFAANTILAGLPDQKDLSMEWCQLVTLIKKDWQTEWRQQHNLYGLLVYAVSTIFVLYLAAGQPDSVQWNTLFWMTQLFVVVNAVIKSFVGEPRGRMLYYHFVAGPLEYLFAKMILNASFMALLSIISLFCFQWLLGNPVVYYVRFFWIMLLGGVGLSFTFTMLSAIAAKARQQSSLVAILGFPVIVPQLVMLIRLSKSGLGEVFNDGGIGQLSWLLLALNGLVVLMAAILFPFLWKD